MPIWLVIICSVAILALVIKLADKANRENDKDAENLSAYVYIGGSILLGLIIMVTS